MSIRVRPMTSEDFTAVVALQRLCFPPPFPAAFLWRDEHLARHLAVFPEGQFVAVNEGAVVGSASACVVSEARWRAHASWEETVGGWYFEGHDSAGTTLYGADIGVHPDRRGQGVGRALYGARLDLVRRTGLARFGTACRLPGFRAWSDQCGGGPRDYVALVAAGGANDPTLSPLMRYGLRLVAVLDDYMEDEASGNAAALLEWTP